MERIMSTKKMILVVGGALAALIVIATVVLVIVLSNLTKAQQDTDYRACVADRGLYETSSIDEMAVIGEGCYKAVYG